MVEEPRQLHIYHDEWRSAVGQYLRCLLVPRVGFDWGEAFFGLGNTAILLAVFSESLLPSRIEGVVWVQSTILFMFCV
jgi:hypothetical protein